MSDDPESSSDEPPLSPATSTRLSWDELHYREREHEFLAPIEIRQDESNEDQIVFQLPRSTTRLTTKIQELRAQDCMRYCFKDCVVYDNTTSSARPLRSDILCREVWQEWFPRRDMERDVADGNFFCNFIRLWPMRDVSKMVTIHSALSERVFSQQSSVKRPEVPRYDTIGVEQDVPFRIRPTFSDAFIVIDKVDWNQEEILLVFKDAIIAAAYGMGEGSPVDQSSAVLFRVKLEEAMDLIVSHAKDRSSSPTEHSYFYKTMPTFSG